MNVLLIVADGLRPDHLHCCGYPKDTSPAIDRLAREGVLFKNTIANCNSTLPGILSLFTGLGQVRHRINDPKSYSQWDSLWKGRRLPFHILQENGYLIAGSVLPGLTRLGYRIIVEDVCRSVEEYRDEHFFMWYWDETTHLPYDPPSRYESMFLPEDYELRETTKEKMKFVRTKQIVRRPGLLSRLETGSEDLIERPGHARAAGEVSFSDMDKPAVLALYDGEVRALDEQIETYLKKLEELGILDETIIVLTADHGEQLLERGALGHSSCSLEGNLYDENIKIPLIMRCPPVIPRGRIVETQVSQIDVMPTLFDMLDLQMPGQTEGHSLFPLIKGEEIDFKEEAYAMTQPCGWQAIEGDDRMIRCIRTPQWKLIHNEDLNSEERSSYELYNLKNNPGEKDNLIKRESVAAEGLKKRLTAWAAGGGKSR